MFVPHRSVPYAVYRSKMHAKMLVEGEHTVVVLVSERELRVCDRTTNEELQSVSLECLSYCTIDPTDEKVIVYATRNSDPRVPLVHGHVFSVADHATALDFTRAVGLAFSKVEPTFGEESPYHLPAVAPSEVIVTALHRSPPLSTASTAARPSVFPIRFGQPNSSTTAISPRCSMISDGEPTYC